MTNFNTTLVFAAPGALNTAVVGSERETSRTEFILAGGPRIKDLTHETDPAATISYDFGIKRGLDIKILANTVDMLRATKPSVGLRPNMPTPRIAGGQFQFVVLQRAGTLTATNIRVVSDGPIV